MILITRPADDAKSFSEKLQSFSLKSFIEPVTIFIPKKFNKTGLSDCVLLTTSKNAMRSLVENKITSNDFSLLLTMTNEMADFAKFLGFINSHSLDCTSVAHFKEKISKNLDKTKKLVYCSGANITFDLCAHLQQAGYLCQKITAYKMQKVKTLTNNCVELLKANKFYCITLFSTRAAKIFCNLCINIGLNPENFQYCVLSQKIGSVLPTKNFSCAKTPNENSIIEEILNSFIKNVNKI